MRTAGLLINDPVYVRVRREGGTCEEISLQKEMHRLPL